MVIFYDKEIDIEDSCFLCQVNPARYAKSVLVDGVTVNLLLCEKCRAMPPDMLEAAIKKNKIILPPHQRLVKEHADLQAMPNRDVWQNERLEFINSLLEGGAM